VPSDNPKGGGAGPPITHPKAMGLEAVVREVVRDELAGRNHGGGNGGNGGNGDDTIGHRIVSLEKSVEHIDGQITDIKADIRELRSESTRQFYAGIAAIVCLVGMIMAGYFRLSDQEKEISNKLSELQLSVLHLADSIANKPR
jgi:hypothetical protein